MRKTPALGQAAPGGADWEGTCYDDEDNGDRLFGHPARRRVRSCRERRGERRKRDEAVRRRLEGGQGGRHDQRPDLAGIPQDLPGAEGRRRGPRRRPGRSGARRRPGAGEFADEASAKAHCPSDTVVWVNTKSHKYHYSGHRSYGTTKQGAYMCEADAKAAGDVAAKDEKEEKAK